MWITTTPECFCLSFNSYTYKVLHGQRRYSEHKREFTFAKNETLKPETETHLHFYLVFLPCYCMRKMSVHQTIGLQENESDWTLHVTIIFCVFFIERKLVYMSIWDARNKFAVRPTLCFYDYFVNVFRMFFACILYVSFFRKEM